MCLFACVFLVCVLWCVCICLWCTHMWIFVCMNVHECESQDRLQCWSLIQELSLVHNYASELGSVGGWQASICVPACLCFPLHQSWDGSWIWGLRSSHFQNRCFVYCYLSIENVHVRSILFHGFKCVPYHV